MRESDQTVIEAARVRRARLSSALTYGALDRRRTTPSTLRRFLASMIVAAVAGVGCAGYSLVVHLLDERRESQVLETLRATLAANPTQPPGVTRDEATGNWVDEDGDVFDPRTGYPIDEDTGLARDPNGRWVDPRTGWYADPETGHLTDPKTGTTVDPQAMTVVED